LLEADPGYSEKLRVTALKFESNISADIQDSEASSKQI
jgi:hypothetical protein